MRVFSLLLLIVFPFFSKAQDSIKLIQSDIPTAIQLAKTEHKPVLFMCYASWCSHCNKMKSEVFKDTSVAHFFNSHFICAGMDMEKGDGVKWYQKLKLRNYPTFLFLDSTGTIIYRMVGEFTAPNFLNEGKNALIQKNQLPFIKQQFENDISNPDKCLAYILALRKGDVEGTEPAKKYLATQTDEQLLSAINWRIIANGINDINSRELKYVIAHQKEFATLTSTFRVERKLLYCVYELLEPMVKNKDTVNYFQYKILATNMHLNRVDSLVFTYDLAIAEATKNWNLYKSVAVENVSKYISKDYFTINKIAKNFIQNVDDKNALQNATEWISLSLKTKEEYDTYLIQAKLYKKLNDKKLAIAAAENAKNLALKYKWDDKEAQSIIDELNKN